jgi:hypothetical protein
MFAVRWAEDCEIAPIQRIYTGNVQPFGLRHDSSIYKIECVILVDFHDFSHPPHIGSGQWFNPK